MRRLLALAAIVVPAAARADVDVGAAVGAGGQGDATYSALELRLDGSWRDVRFGLGARGVWLDGDWRARDWARPIDGLRVLRLLEASTTIADARLALAAGGLAPAQLAHVADGYRATLDDRPRTGVRTQLATERLAITAELDDVIEPGFIGGAVSLAIGDDHVGHAATAIDPDGGSAIELAAARRWSRDDLRVDAGAGVVGEPSHGLHALAFGALAWDHASTRWTIAGELRAGTGTVGGAFGPLYRIERTRLAAITGVGAGGALAVGVAGEAGWLRAGVRWRPELHGLATFEAGAPIARWLAAGAWVAASRHDLAGASELRVLWSKHIATRVELARMYLAPSDEMLEVMPYTPAWSATAWFAVSR
ncbi:MAG TPA: hypothetical protein VFQ53_17410 [Kofleriaceae bacterium]|nr:hypothetical protein [Kofleriaceae bacterium]